MREEIEFIDYIRVIWRRKALIAIVTLGFMAAAGVASFIMPSQYRVYTVVEIGTVKRGDSVKPIEPSSDTKAKVDMVYTYKAMEELGIPDGEFLKLDVNNPKETRIVEISTVSSDVERALSILGKLNEFLLEDHKMLVAEEKTRLGNAIRSLDLQIKNMNQDKKTLEHKLVLLKENKKNIQGQLEETGKRLDELVSEKKRLDLGANPDNVQSMLVFTNEIHQTQRYHNQLEDKLKFEIANNELDIRKELDKEDEQVKTLELKKQNIKAKLETLRETYIVKDPGYLKKPVKPKKVLNVVLSGIAGLLASVFIAFFLTYLDSCKRAGRGISD